MYSLLVGFGWDFFCNIMIFFLKESVIIWLYIECILLDIYGCIDFDIDDKIMYFLLEF